MELGDDRDVDEAIAALQQLGWLATLHLKGVWAFVPAGEPRSSDPYLDLRAWRARDPSAVFALAGDAVAWHLGYVARRFDGPTSLWLPAGSRPPHGLRSLVSVVRLVWPVNDPRDLAPASKLLRRRGLDLVGWADGLPGLGPEALLVQLAARPASFSAWGDLVEHLDVLAGDIDVGRLGLLLGEQSASAWQRAGYLLDRGGRRSDGLALLERRRTSRRPTVSLGAGPESVWSGAFGVNDSLVAPLQRRLGKA